MTGGRGAQLAVWQLNLMRVGFLVMTVGLAVLKWPLLVSHEPWGLAEGTKECLLIAMSFLALLGLRYPQRMLPILLFEVTWKLLWLGVVVLPLVMHDQLDTATRNQAGTVLWVVVIIAVIPWRHVLKQYVLAPGEPWRRGRHGTPPAGALDHTDPPHALRHEHQGTAHPGGQAEPCPLTCDPKARAGRLTNSPVT
jgi:hypothetical protein